MSVFTRLRKSLRLDSNHPDTTDPPRSPACPHSGNAIGYSDLCMTRFELMTSLPTPQYVPSQALKGDKRLNLLNNGDDNQAVEITYINTTRCSLWKVPQPRGDCNTNLPSSSSTTNRRTSLMLPPTTNDRYPLASLTSASTSSYVPGQMVSRKRSATVQGHESVTHPYARALEGMDLEERKDSIDWTRSLKRSAAPTTQPAQDMSNPSSSKHTAPSSKSSSLSKKDTGNSHSRRQVHSRQRSLPATSVENPSHLTPTTSSTRRGPPPPIRVPVLHSQRLPVLNGASIPGISAEIVPRELAMVVEEVDQENDRGKSIAADPQALKKAGGLKERKEKLELAEQSIPSTSMKSQGQSSKLDRPPNPLLAHPPQAMPRDVSPDGADVEEESNSLITMREILTTNGFLQLDPHPSTPPHLSLEGNTDGESLKSAWRDLCRASGHPIDLNTPVLEYFDFDRKVRNHGKVKSRASSVRQDSATLPGDVFQKAQEELLERLSVKSGKSGKRRSKGQGKSVGNKKMNEMFAVSIPTTTHEASATAMNRISTISSGVSPSDFPMPPSLPLFVQGSSVVPIPTVDVTSASPEKGDKEAFLRKKDGSNATSSNSSGPSTTKNDKRGTKQIRKSVSESSLRRSRDALLVEPDRNSQALLLHRGQERDRPAISPIQVPMSAAYSHHSDETGFSPLLGSQGISIDHSGASYGLTRLHSMRHGGIKKRVTSMSLEDLPMILGDRWAPEVSPPEETTINGPVSREKEVSSDASSLPTPPLVFKDSTTSLSSSTSPSTGMSLSSGNLSGSSFNLNSHSGGGSNTTLASKTEVAVQAQPRIHSIILEQPIGFANVSDKRRSSHKTNLLPIGMGIGERRPSAPTVGEQPKPLEQRRPSLPVTKQVTSETTVPKLPVGVARKETLYGPRPHPSRKGMPESVVPHTTRSNSPALSSESGTRLGTSPNSKSVLSYLSKPQTNRSNETHGRDRSNSRSSIRSRNSGSASVMTPGPDFFTIPIRWRGLTMDAAKWTMTSQELQGMVREAIQHSAKDLSIKLLHPDVLKSDIPKEKERLQQAVEQLQRKYKSQVRRRRVLFKSLSIYSDGTDPVTAKRLIEDLVDVTTTCDALAEELYQVTDQLSQVQHLYDNHYTSALAMALRKINASLLKRDKQNKELKDKVAALEAEREYAWEVARTVEEEAKSMNVSMISANNSISLDRSSSSIASPMPPSLEQSNSRVEAARRGASRLSQASLHISSTRRSIRTSFSSSRLPSRPSSSQTHGDSGAGVPPVPPVPLTAVTLQSRPSSDPQIQYTPSSRSSLAETFDEAQAALMDLLGLVSHDPPLNGLNRRRSASFCSPSPRKSGCSFNSKDEQVIRVRSSSGSLKSNLTRRHSLSALNPSDDPLLKSQSGVLTF